MTDITRHNAKTTIYGTAATAADAAVEVVIPQLGVLEGANVTLGAVDNAVGLKHSVSGITLTITPASTVGDTAAVFYIEAWGY